MGARGERQAGRALAVTLWLVMPFLYTADSRSLWYLPSTGPLCRLQGWNLGKDFIFFFFLFFFKYSRKLNDSYVEMNRWRSFPVSSCGAMSSFLPRLVWFSFQRYNLSFPAGRVELRHLQLAHGFSSVLLGPSAWRELLIQRFAGPERALGRNNSLWTKSRP